MNNLPRLVRMMGVIMVMMKVIMNMIMMEIITMIVLTCQC